MKGKWKKCQVIEKDGGQIKVRYSNGNKTFWTQIDNELEFGNEEWLSKIQSRYISDRDKYRILFRQGMRCAYIEGQKRCKADFMTMEWAFDHKKALMLGGKTHIDNLHALCPNCHRKKTIKDIAKARQPKSTHSSKD